MLSRFALAGLAMALLAPQVAVAAATLVPNEPAALDVPPGISTAAKARPKRNPVRLAALVLPPPKPDDLREIAPEPPRAPSFPNPFAAFVSPAPQPSEPSQASSSAAAPEASTSWFGTLLGGQGAQPRGTQLPRLATRAEIDELITQHAKLNGVPEALVHRIVIRESKYNPRAVGRGGAMGLMQIKTGTARALGYQGGPAGLLDAETNITYAVKYLAGAYRTAGGNHDMAVSHYASGYYYAAKRKGLIETSSHSRPRRRPRPDAAPAEPGQAAAPATPSFFSFASGTQAASAR